MGQAFTYQQLPAEVRPEDAYRLEVEMSLKSTFISVVNKSLYTVNKTPKVHHLKNHAQCSKTYQELRRNQRRRRLHRHAWPAVSPGPGSVRQWQWQCHWMSGQMTHSLHISSPNSNIT